MKKPPAIGPGARVALVSPAGPLAPGAVDRAAQRVIELGWTPVIGKHAERRHGYLAGTDQERLSDFDEALRSPHNQAIWCLRGGYGTMRFLAAIDWSALVARPRPLIGFSDNTALHLAVQRKGVVSFHGPHPAAADLSEFSLRGLRSILQGTRGPEAFPFPFHGSPARTLVPGFADGPLMGGNLSLLAATMGTPFQVVARGCILFLEEVGEAAYRIDRLLSQLLLGGAFDEVVGIAVGGITEVPDSDDGGAPTPEQVLADRLAPLGVPLVTGLPFGHLRDSWTLPLGVSARLDATAATLELLEPAVTT